MTEIKEKFNIKESLGYILFKNPVLVLGLVIGQLAAGDTSLQNGVALSILYLFISLATLVFASLFGKYLPRFIAPVCYAAVAAVCLVPAYFICAGFSATIFDSLGIYPALLAVSTVPIVYASKVAEKQSLGEAAMNGLCIALGFAFTAIILGGARELFGYGTLWGAKVMEASFPAVKLPFWGFILLGFMAAAVNLVKEIFGKNEEEGVKA